MRAMDTGDELELNCSLLNKHRSLLPSVAKASRFALLAPLGHVGISYYIYNICLEKNFQR